ncbi:MAG: hypothetical protein ACE5GF_06150 [Thermodesulfobacteriota bacterium]
MRSGNTLGNVYRCPVCGAELSVIRAGGGRLAPVCCNRRMELLERVNKVYLCSICHCEVMHIVEGGGSLSPNCCNQPMKKKVVESALP